MNTKLMKKILILIFLFLPLLSHAETSPSFYDYQTKLTDQEGQIVPFDIWKGHPVILSMFYTSCSYTCPLLFDAIKKIDQQLSPEKQKEVRYLLISLDPQTDTPAVLKKKALEAGFDLTRVKLVTGTDDQVREIASLLGIAYKKSTDGSINHSTNMTLLDAAGKLKVQTEDFNEGILKILKSL